MATPKTKKEWVELLRNDPTAFERENEARLEQLDSSRDHYLDLREIDLYWKFVSSNLRFVDLSGSHCVDTRFQGENLSHVKFCGASMRKAIIGNSRGTIEACDFNQAQCYSTRFDLHRINSCSFEKCMLQGATFRVLSTSTVSELQHCSFRNAVGRIDIGQTRCNDCDFTAAVFHGTTCIGTQFRNCNFQSADFQVAQFGGAGFHNCKFPNSKLQGSDFSNSQFHGYQNLEAAQLQGAAVFGVKGFSEELQEQILASIKASMA